MNLLFPRKYFLNKYVCREGKTILEWDNFSMWNIYHFVFSVKISVNDLVIKAASTALQYVPEININSVGEDDFQVMPNVDISVAVATDSGLITPIVKDVPSLSLGQISDTVRELAGKAKAGKLQLNEFQASCRIE